jgi:Kef-type K+ transport system membrane component KefB
MDDGPTIFTIPHYLAVRAARLRAAARAHVLLVPLAIWLPLFARFHGLRAVIVSAVLFVGFWALLQIAPLGAPRTMRRRYRRLTAQAGLIALAAFCLLAVAMLLDVWQVLIALGALALDAPVIAFLLVSLPVYLAPHAGDVPRP